MTQFEARPLFPHLAVHLLGLKKEKKKTKENNLKREVKK